MKLVISLAAAALVSQTALADSTWLEAGDGRLRADLTLLVDRHVLDMPINSWPIPAADVTYALDNAVTTDPGDAALAAALSRVRSLVGDRQDHGYRASEVGIRGGRPGLLRDFDSTMREDGEINDKADFKKGPWSGQLSFTAVTAAADEQAARIDGSHLTYQLGNWLFSANTLDRYWGPGYESSLILSQNARPMPALSLDRATSRAFVTPWLCWLGPWRYRMFLGQFEEDRRDVRSPLFFTQRLEIKPTRSLEIGLSRTAQFCGSGRSCGLTTVKDMLIGNTSSAPGGKFSANNQNAGFDARLTSPWQWLPVAVYSQMIGRDQQHLVPFKYLSQFGAEAWYSLAGGATLRGFVEYADTACSGTSRKIPFFNCAYNSVIFNVEGDRYRGRVIGDSIDADGQIWSAGLRLVEDAGQEWRLHIRDARLNRGAGPNSHNTVSALEGDYRSVEVGWRGSIGTEQLDLSVGAESLQAIGGPRQTKPIGALIWRHPLQQSP